MDTQEYQRQIKLFEDQMGVLISGVPQDPVMPSLILTLTSPDGSPRFVIPLTGRGLDRLIRDLGSPWD